MAKTTKVELWNRSDSWDIIYIYPVGELPIPQEDDLLIHKGITYRVKSRVIDLDYNIVKIYIETYY